MAIAGIAEAAAATSGALGLMDTAAQSGVRPATATDTGTELLASLPDTAQSTSEAAGITTMVATGIVKVVVGTSAALAREATVAPTQTTPAVLALLTDMVVAQITTDPAHLIARDHHITGGIHLGILHTVTHRIAIIDQADQETTRISGMAQAAEHQLNLDQQIVLYQHPLIGQRLPSHLKRPNHLSPHF